jgi:hypothetical protein
MRIPKNQQSADWQETALQRLESIQKRCKCGACQPPKPKLPPGTHRLKIQPKFVQRGLLPDTQVPQLLLAGEWLRRTGFECNNHVLITTDPGQLIIRLETA